MKYYAVTDDPRELYHYGVKGMKWGQHIFGDEPKSPGYHKALSKLRASAKKATKVTISGVKTIGKVAKATASQIAYNKRAKEEKRYNKAVQKAQRRIDLTNALSSLDREDKFRKQVNRDRKIEQLRERQSDIIANNDLKTLSKAVKVEKKMPKYYQQAREGTLKYGKLSDEQIGRLQNRLVLEAQTRRLGNTEAPLWRQQKKMARREGYLQGITKGTSAAMEEVARAGVQYGIKNLANRKKLDKQNELRAEREKTSNRIKNNKTAKEMRQDLRKEAYKEELESGTGFWNRGFGTHMTVADAARKKLDYKEKADERKFLTEERHNAARNERQDRENDAREERKFLMEERHNSIRNERQNRENEEREERARELAGKMAYEYGTLLSPAGKNNGNQQQKKGQKNLPQYSNDDVDQLSKWYEQKYINGETNQQKQAREKAQAEYNRQVEAVAADRERRQQEAERKAAEDRAKFEREQQQKLEAEQEEKRRQQEAKAQWAAEKDAEKREAAERARQNLERRRNDYAERQAEEAAANYRKRQEAKERGEVSYLTDGTLDDIYKNRRKAARQVKPTKPYIRQIHRIYAKPIYQINLRNGEVHSNVIRRG